MLDERICRSHAFGALKDVPRWLTAHLHNARRSSKLAPRATVKDMKSHPNVRFVPRVRGGYVELLGAWLSLGAGACASSGGDEGSTAELVSDDSSTAVSNSSIGAVDTASTSVTSSSNSTSASNTPSTSPTIGVPKPDASEEPRDVAPASSSNTVTDTEPTETAPPVDAPSTPNASMPRLPPISGTCPEFETGTATIGGLSGVALQVGAKQSGTGSLVFYWHGTGSSASEVNTFLPRAVRQEILDAGGIIVSFDDSTGTGGDCSGTSTFSKDDFEIADLIAACAVRDHAIDPTRIYSTGCSAGGLQAGCMGAMRSSYIAAVAPNSGGEVTRQIIEDPTHTPAVMTMHGGSSDVVVIAFSRTSATFDAHMKEAGSFVVNCDHGGGHCRAPSELYSAAWEFMKAHPFGVEPSPFQQGLPESFPDYCTVY